MELIVSKEELRKCIKIKYCERCTNLKECQFKNDKDVLINKNFIHIDLGGYYGKRTNKTSTSKNKTRRV